MENSDINTWYLLCTCVSDINCDHIPTLAFCYLAARSSGPSERSERAMTWWRRQVSHLSRSDGYTHISMDWFKGKS